MSKPFIIIDDPLYPKEPPQSDALLVSDAEMELARQWWEEAMKRLHRKGQYIKPVLILAKLEWAEDINT